MDMTIFKKISENSLDQIEYKKNNVFKVTDKNNNKYIVKLNKGKGLKAQLLSNLFFKHELSFYLTLHDSNLKHLNYPKLIETNGESYFMIEYIEGVHKWNQSILEHKNIIDLLIEFQTKTLSHNKFSIRQMLIDFLYKVNFRVIRQVLLNIPTLKFKNSLKVFLLVLRLNIKQKQNKIPLTVHNDIFNIIQAEDDLYIFDFESITHEKKWVFTDIIDASLDTESLKFNSKFFNKYYNKISNHQITNVPFSKRAQIRMGLLNRVLHALFSNKGKKRFQNKKMYLDFLTNTLLNEDDFEKWYAEHIEERF